MPSTAASPVPDDAKARLASSFDTAADAYARGRPSYPEAALDWLLPPGASRVLDLGAGTGKLTALLAARGLNVVAVDPSGAMLERLRDTLPGVEALQGTAEAIPQPSGAFDSVLVAQAWHWVQPARAVPEVARVLKPGGRLGLLWNHRDESDGWARDLGAILARIGFAEDISRSPPVGAPFGPVETREVAWSTPVSAADVVALVASRSYVSVLPEAEKAAVIRDVEAVLAQEPGFVAAGGVPMRYLARCYRATLA